MARSNSLEEYHRRSRAHRFDKWANNNNGSSIAIRSRVVQIPVKHQGAQLTRSTPASNGMTFTERTQGRAHVQTFANRVTWTSLKEDIGCSPAELLFGTTLQVPGEFFVNCKESRREAQKTNVYASSDTIITAYKNRDHSGKRQSQRSCRSSAGTTIQRSIQNYRADQWQNFQDSKKLLRHKPAHTSPKKNLQIFNIYRATWRQFFSFSL